MRLYIEQSIHTIQNGQTYFMFGNIHQKSGFVSKIVRFFKSVARIVGGDKSN